MSKLDCKNCKHYVSKMYAGKGKKEDPRCTHYSARLGREMDSFMTISEARLPPSKYEIAGVEVVTRNACGPNAVLFEQRRNV